MLKKKVLQYTIAIEVYCIIIEQNEEDESYEIFLIVDAFTETAFGGNPAGVVILPENADFSSDETMVKTAAELRYSETAFIKKLADNEFKIRYFTPAAEVDLCGHATIGSFFVL